MSEAGGGRREADGHNAWLGEASSSPHEPPVATPVLAMSNILVQDKGRTLLEIGEFSISAGESVALIGPNGAGKTTLLHIAALLRPPDSGTLTIRGQRATRENAAALRRRLSVVFQDPLLFDTTVLENATAGLRFAGMPRAEAERCAAVWLARFGIGHLATRRARRLSGGEAGRVALARAFAVEPALLLLDEPFASLDGPTRAALLPELRQQLRDTGTAAVLVTHDLDEAFAFGDRLAVLDRGRIVAAGSPADLIARPPSREAAMLLSVENIFSGIVRDIHAGCARIDLLPDGPTLQARLTVENSASSGDRVTVTFPANAAHVRNSHIAEHPEWNTLTGQIAEVTIRPAGSRVVVNTPVPIVANEPWMPAGISRCVGEHAVVAVPPGAIHLIG